MSSREQRSFSIRDMREQDLPRALALTQAENWPHRSEDWQLHFRLAKGWAACDDAGRVVGTTLLWPYGEAGEIATVGLIVVDRDWQGRGIGRSLLQTALDNGNIRQFRLVATEAGARLYQQCGFEKTGVICQRQGIPAALPQPSPPPGTTLRDARHTDRDSLIALDARAFGANRTHLMGELLALGHCVVLEDPSGIRAFATIRPGGRGLQFGPVVAESTEQAKALIHYHLWRTSGFTRIDVTGQASELSQWLDDIGLPTVDQVTAMRRGKDTDESTGHAHTFALVSQAFG